MPKSTRRRTTRPALNSAEFNVREIAKQMLLLEDHLSDDDKFCKDCIRKHLMMIEGLAEEAVTLGPDSPWKKYCKDLAVVARKWMVRFTDKATDRYAIAKEIRMIRKKMVEKVYDPRQSGVYTSKARAKASTSKTKRK